MTQRRIGHAIICAACSLFVLLAYAGPKDFWVTKPYTEWSAKEVERILLKDSPWTYQLLLNSSSSGAQIATNSKGGGGGSSKGGGGDTGGGGDSAAGGASGGAGGSSGGPPPIYINWYARPIREALARQTMLLVPNAPQQQIDNILNYKSEFYEVLVTGMNLGGGGRGGREGRGAAQSGDSALAKFKEETYLLKKNNMKIPLANLVLPRNRNAATHLQFAKEADGKPTLTPEDKEVTLVIRINEQSYKFKFEFAKMMIGDKLEL